MPVKHLLPLAALAVCLSVALHCTKYYTINAETVVLNVAGDSAIDRMFFRQGSGKYLMDSLTALVKAAVEAEIRAGGAGADRGLNSGAPAAAIPPDTLLEPLMVNPAELAFLDTVFKKEDVDILKNVKRVVSYRLDPTKKGDGPASFNGFAPVGPPVELNGTQAAYLRGILLNKAHYKRDGIVKNCTFLPEIGFRCYAGDSAFVDLMVAFYCDDWRFVSGRGQFHNDCGSAREMLLRLARNIYSSTD